MTILNTKGELDVVTGNIDNSTKLSQAEKNALKAATNLKVVGDLTAEDWYGLQKVGATTLDLSEAMLGKYIDTEDENKVKYDYSECRLEGELRDNVQNLTLPNNAQYTSVPSSFAYNALALETVTFPSNITSIGESAFYHCENLTDISLPSNLTTIGASAFSRSGLTKLVLPGKLSNVGTEAFFNCGQLENMEMKALTGSCSFGERAFGSCFQLKHVTLSEGVDAISDQMFDKCTMLESIRIPSTCETIGQEAFNICASLHSIVIPEGVKLIKKQAFTNSGITDVYVMATSEDKVPAIYSMGSNWGGNDGTFGSAMVTGNSHDPYDKHNNSVATEKDRINNKNNDEATILSWYQEDFSDGRLGVGGGDCLVRLHYPESMRYFYDGYENPVTDATWTPTANDALSSSEITAKLAKIQDANANHYISEGYAGGERAFGPDQYGNYWPSRIDYLLRLEAGDPTRYKDPKDQVSSYSFV